MFRVVWRQSALNELAALWLKADKPTRKAITAATHQIDELLKTDPFEQSESRANGKRIMFLEPLGVVFELVSESSTVRVLHTWYIRRKK